MADKSLSSDSIDGAPSQADFLGYLALALMGLCVVVGAGALIAAAMHGFG